MIAKNSFLVWFSRRNTLLIFLTGKLIRYIFYFAFLYFLLKQTRGFLNYDTNQALFFAVTYLLIDVLSQFLFRSVYTFRQLVITGDLDLILLNPVNSLFRVLMGGPDFIDFITLPPIIAIVVYIGHLLDPSFLQIIYYIFLVINGILISSAFHIIVLSVGVLYFEVDNIIMIYRDFVSMARIPIDLYREPLRGFLTFVVPVGVMITLPAKAFTTLLSPVGVISAIIFGISIFIISIKFWYFALEKYSSASS